MDPRFHMPQHHVLMNEVERWSFGVIFALVCGAIAYVIRRCVHVEFLGWHDPKPVTAKVTPKKKAVEQPLLEDYSLLEVTGHC